MDAQAAKDFRERWQAVAAVESEEQRNASVALRWQQTNAILRLAMDLKMPVGTPDELEAVVRRRWARLKEMRT